MQPFHLIGPVALVLALGTTGRVNGQPAPLQTQTQVPPAAEDEAGDELRPRFQLGAYLETLYQWNFNNPSNGITNFRGFDNRHDSFTLSNIAVDGQWESGPLSGRLTLQIGHTPSTYYLAEPALRGASGANATNAELWKYVQQAYAAYRVARLRDLTISTGIFLSPIGPETMAVRDNWNWSRSDLFFGLPFYHTGVRATVPITDAWAVTLAAYNGWSSVVDNNAQKSLSAQVTLARPQLVWSLLYFGGVERASAAPEGRAFRQLIDTHVTRTMAPRLSVLAHANAGFEPNDFGTSHWLAGALYGRFQLARSLFLAARGDLFAEHVAQSSKGRASPIFWPASWVSSVTTTLDYRPYEQLALRLEHRHDQAEQDMYFGGRVQPAAPPRRR